MTKRHDEDAGDVTNQLRPLVDDDAFLTALSGGSDPSDGSDELATLLLGLRSEVEERMPPPPLIEGADDEADAPEMPVVISLGEHRGRRHRRSRPLLSGLLGAAAATLLIAGSGAAIYNATPGSPLWGLNNGIFSDRTAVVELAGTLDELDSRTAEGDMVGARALVEEARLLVESMNERENEREQQVTVTRTPERTTVTAPPRERGPAPEPVTETVTVTETESSTVRESVVVTTTVIREPQPQPTPTPEPEPQPTPTTDTPPPSSPAAQPTAGESAPPAE